MTYVFDLDGTLSHTNGLDYTDAVPDTEAIARVNALYEAGHRIVIDSSRGYGAQVDYEDATRQQLDRWGVRYHKLRCGWKIPGDYYVDAKALRPEEVAAP